MAEKFLTVDLPSLPSASETTFKRRKVGFVSLGCPKNLVDSEVMTGMLAEAGAELTHETDDAEVLVVNTCSLIDRSRRQTVGTFPQMQQRTAAGRTQIRVR